MSGRPIDPSPSTRAGRDRLQVALFGAVVALGVLIVAFVGSEPSVLCLLPILALSIPLLLHRYPGERLLRGFALHRRRRWSRARSSAPTGRRVYALAARGGLLLGRALAVRPPPRALRLAS